MTMNIVMSNTVKSSPPAMTYLDQAIEDQLPIDPISKEQKQSLLF